MKVYTVIFIPSNMDVYHGCDGNDMMEELMAPVPVHATMEGAQSQVANFLQKEIDELKDLDEATNVNFERYHFIPEHTKGPWSNITWTANITLTYDLPSMGGEKEEGESSFLARIYEMELGQ